MYSIFLNLDILNIDFPIKIFQDYVDDLLSCRNIDEVNLSYKRQQSLFM